MKTLETINGQKVWAVDATHACDGCMFKDNPITNTCFQRCDDERPDKRNVIFLPYEEELKEKIFTLSQINEVMGDIHKWCAFNLSAPEHVVAYKVLSQLIQKLEQL